jgi:hypothetical protein
MQSMLDETLLLGIASIAVAVAGFTAVTAALTPPGGSWSAAHRIRQRAIVSTSFNVVFEGLAPIIVYAWLVDARASIVISSAVATLYLALVVGTRGRQLFRAGAFGTWSGRLLFTPAIFSWLLFAANALVLGSPAAYALAMCIQLSVSVISFYQLVAAASA